MYDTYIFDIDGTLLDTEVIILSALQQLLLEINGRHYSREDLLFAMGETSEDTMKILNVENPSIAVKLWLDKIKKSAQHLSPFDGIRPLIQTLALNHKKLGIVTSKNREELAYDFNRTALPPFFEVIITANDTEKPKPAPDPLLACIQQLNGSAHSTLFVGDTIYDANCAKEAGVDFGLALWGAKEHNVPFTYAFSHPLDVLEKTMHGT